MAKKDVIKESPIQKILDELVKQAGERQVIIDAETTKEIEVNGVPTGSSMVDSVIGLTGKSGFPRGKITEVYGWESAGKTALCTAAAIKCVNEGGMVIFLDFEKTFSVSRAEKLGLDVKKYFGKTFVVIRPKHMDEGYQLLYNALQTNKIDMVIIDSIPAMNIITDIDENSLKMGAIAEYARYLDTFLKIMQHLISNSKTAFVVTNQMRTKFIKRGQFMQTFDAPTGGNAIKFYAALRLELKEIEKIMEEGQEMGIRVQCRSIKSKVSVPFRKGEFVIRYDVGIDDTYSLLDVGIEKEIIKVAGGGNYTICLNGEEIKIKGKENVRNYLVNDPIIRESLLKEINSLVKIDNTTKPLDEEDDGNETPVVKPLPTKIDDSISDENDIIYPIK
ncbi:MAG: AAA family ATPase [Candidatus Paceibacterota bacterium]|jgi:recombination protein RecA